MKFLIYFNSIMVFLFYSNSYAQKTIDDTGLTSRSNNTLTFTPISQNITINSDQSFVAQVDVRAFGSSPDPLFYNTSILSLDDAGLISFSADGIIDVFEEEEHALTFRFQQVVTTTTTSQYRFNVRWNANSTNNIDQEIIINVTYNPTDEGSDDSCIREPPNNLFTTVVGFNEVNNPERSFASATISREFTTNTAGGFWYTEIREKGVSDWSRGTFDNRDTRRINDLKENQEYEWRASSCNDGRDPTPIYSFRTLGECGTAMIVESDVPPRSNDARTGSVLVTATNEISNNASALYSSGNTVFLKPGFKASAGSFFRAYVEDCNSYPSPDRSVSNTFAFSKNETDPETLITLYPNPTTGQFTISNEDLNIVDWDVYDQFGVSQVKNKQKSILNKSITVDLSNEHTGVYFMQVLLKSGEVVSKSIIKK